jgi:membrane protease YdiL (CAAX protease family)
MMLKGRLMNNNESLQPKPSRREQIFELLVFLFLIVPSMVLSFFAINQGGVSFTLTAVATIARDLALVCLILFFVWRNREGVRAIGWNFEDFWREAVLGAFLFIPVFFAAGLLDSFLQSIGFSAPSTPLPTTPTVESFSETILAFILVVIVAFAEETIFRGYLILRLEGIFNSPAWAVILSAVIFSLGHGYEGSSGVVTVGAIGAVFAIVYLWRRSLTAPMVMHFLQDFLSIVLLPLLMGK